MKWTVVRYKVKPERAEENARLIEQVFGELQAKAPDGARYMSLRLGDGTFIHVAEAEDGANPIPELAAFRAFQSAIAERCLEPPQVQEATVVGQYRMASP